MSSVPTPLPAGLPSTGEILSRAALLSDRLAACAAAEPDRAFPEQEFRWIANEGWLALPLSQDLGGWGLGNEPGVTLALLQVLKHVGRGSLPVGRIYEGHVNALQLVQRFGAPDRAARWAADARNDGRIFGVWNAEPGGGAGIRFERVADGRWRLLGSKHFASGLGRVTRPIITGRLPDGGWQMCIVPMESAGAREDLSWWKPLGMEATASGAVDFTGVELDESDLLGGPDDYYRDPWFNGGAIRFVAVHLGGAEAIHDAVRAYAREFNQQDQPPQRTRLASMAMAVESGNLWLRGAAAAAEAPGADIPAVIAYAGMARMAVETICLDVLREAQRCVGARGLLRPWPFERLVRDLTMYLRQPAPDAIIERIGRQVLENASPAFAQWPGADHP